MKKYVSLLRGINVSGQKKIRMEELKKLYESLGFKNVQTYIQSGNVIFEFSNTSLSKLRINIEQKIKQVYSFDVKVVIRTREELQSIVKHTPFSKKDNNRIYITFLSDMPTHIPTNELTKAKNISEEFFIFGREVYFFCPTGYGKTKLSNIFFEKKLHVFATTRNWKTVTTLLELIV